MIKVLTIITSHFGFDGISNVATNYYIYQNHLSVKMDFVTINPITSSLQKNMEKNGDSLFILPYRNSNPIKYIITLKNIVKKNNYDIVHIHGNSSTMLVELLTAKLGNVKIRIAHSHNTTCDHKILNNLLKPFFKNAYTEGFSCGKEAGEWLFAGKNYHVISNGVDLEKFTYTLSIRNEMRAKYDLEDKFIIGHVGRFSLQKNHKKLISIFEKLIKLNKNAELVLLGDGELRHETEEYCKQHDLNVLFVGNSNEVDRWLQAFDIILFPSLFEGLPLFLIEAQAAGVDCFISDTISSMTKITPLVHFIPLKDSDEEWCKAIVQTNLSDRFTDKASIQEHIRSAHFDIRKNCEGMKKLYFKLLNV